MKVLIYGGSFDPVHKGHFALLKAAVAHLNPDKTHIFTAYQSPFKDTSAVPFKVRQSLAKTVLSPISPNIIFDDFEQKAARITYTWQTIEHIKKLYPNAKIYLLIGTDCLNSIHTWKNAEYIFDNATIVAGKREGFKFETKSFNFMLLDGVFPLISSTNIRLAILSNGLIPNNLPQAAATYIEENLMYGLKIHKWLYANLKPNRYLHVKLVAQAAVELAKYYSVNQEASALAAILHDSAKAMDDAHLIKYAKEHKLKIEDFDIISKNSPSLLHAPVSAALASELFEVKDKEILAAISSHTLGAPNMSALAKILFIADMASKDRRYQDAKRVQEAATLSLDEGVLAAMAIKLNFTIETRKWLAPSGIKLWNEILSKHN
ncbi:MAG: nicotinate (nicotinamide) nucleotide adenylyltransferase [Elusimicrobiota bacterium]|jgi:nicotinate-nucleotide adenylyltransferase|nr:nicotinate (nicotinamide) nucleotide adenylyltransferase [Elusimicrobiota bacterium]